MTSFSQTLSFLLISSTVLMLHCVPSTNVFPIFFRGRPQVDISSITASVQDKNSSVSLSNRQK